MRSTRTLSVVPSPRRPALEIPRPAVPHDFLESYALMEVILHIERTYARPARGRRARLGRREEPREVLVGEVADVACVANLARPDAKRAYVATVLADGVR